MDFRSEFASRYLRIVAMLALLLGLADAARLLGVSSGETSPIEILGPAGFGYLAAFCVARLFSVVGLVLRLVLLVSVVALLVLSLRNRKVPD